MKIQRTAAQERRRRKRETDPGPALWPMLWEATKDEFTVEGWCSQPWQDFRSILRLVLDLSPVACPTNVRQLFETAMADGARLDRLLYDWSAELRDEVARTLVDGDLLIAGLRCVELASARSHGGGWTYNEPLRRALDALILRGMSLALVADAVEAARLQDCLGRNPPPLRVQAFREAWRAGRFRLAVLLAEC